MRNRIRLGRLVVASAVLAGVLNATPAVATHSSVIVNHWELLGERPTGLLVNTTIPVHRGALPGGTSKFDPQPTATFVLVGKVGTGTGSWTVSLRDGAGASIAAVALSTASSAYQIHEATVSWPASDRALADIQATNSLGGTRVLDIQKAYVKITQSGTIKKTVPHAPIATRQGGLVWTPTSDWSELSDPILYKHVAADFDPAPSVRLRVTGRTNDATCGALDVRLVATSGDPVGGQTQNVGAQWQSVEVPISSLVDGETYRVQVKPVKFCYSATATTAELLNADLMFEQSTTNPHGLGKTVAWYPNVSAPTTATSSGQQLGFLFRAPGNAAMSQAFAYEVSMKRTDGSGDAGINLIDVSNPNSPLASVATNSTSFVRLGAPLSQSPPAGATLDAITNLPSGTSGQVAQAALRGVLLLREITPPTVAQTWPKDQGNTVFEQQPLLAKITDADSGVDGASAALTLKDETAGSAPVTVPSIFDASTGWLRSTTHPVLINGHEYLASLSVSDLVGNVLQHSWRFRRISLEIPQGEGEAVATIPSTEDSTSVLNGDGTTTYTFSDVSLEMSEYEVRLIGLPAHAGIGHVKQTVPLTAALVHLYMSTPEGDVELDGSPFSAPAEWGTRTTFAQVVTTDRVSADQEIPVLPVFMAIPSLSFTTPLTADKAVIELETASTPSVPVCSDPSLTCAESVFPTPDPFPFYMSDHEADRTRKAWVIIKAELTEDITGESCPVPDEAIDDPPCVLPQLSKYVHGLVYPLKFMDLDQVWDVLAGTFAPGTWDTWYQIRVLYNHPVLPPQVYNAICDDIPCDSPGPPPGQYAVSQTPPASAEENEYICLDKHGNAATDHCYQYAWAWIWEHDPARDGTCNQGGAFPGCNPSKPWFHTFAGGVIATYGLNDFAGKDELLLGADTALQYNQHPQVFGIHDPQNHATGGRQYMWTHDEMAGGTPVLDGYADWEDCKHYNRNSSDRYTWQEASTGGSFDGYTGMRHTNLKQTQNWYETDCAWDPEGGDHGQTYYNYNDRLWDGYLYGVFNSGGVYYGTEESKVAAVFGHKKRGGWSGSWGCGPGFGIWPPGPGFSCGWAYGPDNGSPEDAWQIAAVTNFQW